MRVGMGTRIGGEERVDKGEESRGGYDVMRRLEKINSVWREMWPMRGEGKLLDLAQANWWLRYGTIKLKAVLC